MVNELTFEYTIIMEEGHGFKQTMSVIEETEITIQIKAKNRATADRMVRCLLNDKVSFFTGICISD